MKLTLTDITGFTNQSVTANTINENSAAIETALENTLSRDGTSPNEMNVDLDMDSNDLLNVGTIGAVLVDAQTVDTDDLLADTAEIDTAEIEELTITGHLQFGPESIQGIIGPEGPQGPTGATGAAGPQGIQGDTGPAGADGADGQGVPTGGTTGQVLAKIDGTDYNTEWVTPAAAVADGDKGDIVVSSSGTVWSIDSGVIVNADINASAAIDATKIADGSVTNAEFQRLDATSSIQTQLDGKQPLDADLTSWAGVTRASGFDTFAATPSSANLRALLTDEVGTGAFYTVGGALGTPASATLTNATGLPVSGITASTSTAIGVGSIELGHATDTTLSRSASGKVDIEGHTILTDDEEDQTISGGARVTVKDLGNLSGNSITPDPGDRPIQKITNNGAGSILPGSNEGQYTLEVINTTGAGAITTTGWTLKGDSFDTTTTSKFLCSCFVTSDIKAMSILKIV